MFFNFEALANLVKGVPLKKAIIFDLDGTLVDTAQDLMTAGNAFFQEMGFGSLLSKGQHEAVAIGGGRAMIRYGLEASQREVTEEILNYYYPKLLNHYKECLVDTSYVYPEVQDVLVKLRSLGWELGICTNKPAYLAKELLKRLNLESYFASLVGSDTFPYRKPDPRALMDTIKLLNAEVKNSVLIGDSKTDRDTASAAGVPIIMVQFGHGALNHDLHSLKPDAIINNFSEIPDLAKSLIN